MGYGLWPGFKVGLSLFCPYKYGGTVTLGDGSCQCCLPVVHMANGANVHVGLVTDESLRVPPLGEGGVSQGSTRSRGKGLYG